MKIMFMGTPEIATICLRRLVEDGHNITAVISREDKPRGRGTQLSPTPTKAYALEKGIAVYTPSTLRDEAFAQLLREVSPELIVVVAYGKILPRSVLDFPKYGCINLHVSLLPRFRGSAPMQRAIMAGDKETGVTVMCMDEGLDTGDILAVRRFPIGPEDNLETVHDRSAEIGGALLSEIIPLIESGSVERVKQNDAEATYAAKIEKSDCKIDFTKSAAELDCIIRGVTPIPGAFAYLNGRMLKICKAHPVSGKGECGKVIDLDGVGDGSITVACGEGALKVLSVIPEGKGRMSAGDLIRGRKIALGDILS